MSVAALLNLPGTDLESSEGRGRRSLGIEGSVDAGRVKHVAPVPIRLAKAVYGEFLGDVSATGRGDIGR